MTAQDRVGAGLLSLESFDPVAAVQLRDAIGMLVAAERERCAKLVETLAENTPGPSGPDITVLIDAAMIAAKIRSGE